MERITTSETLWDVLGKAYDAVYRLQEIENILGLCVDVIPIIKRTFDELCANPRIYEPRETQNFWGDVEMLQHFFWWILHDWEDFKKEYPEIVSVVTFWIY